MPAPARLFLASSNPGKLREYRALAGGFARGESVSLDLLPGFARFPAFEESAPTFAENAAGKALHYSQYAAGLIFADDSGLVVPALGGAPGAKSARYAGGSASDAERVRKLLEDLRGKPRPERSAHFVCAIALAERGRVQAVLTGRVDGEIVGAPRGAGGFGYDPVFFFPPAGRSFAELSPEEKNLYSHRGKTFRKLLACLSGDL